MDSWSCLRDGYIGSALIPCAETRVHSQPVTASVCVPVHLQQAVVDDEDEVHVQVYSDIAPGLASALSSPVIEAMDHIALKSLSLFEKTNTWDEKICTVSDVNNFLPLVNAAPFPEEEIQDISVSIHSEEEDSNLLTASMQSLVSGLMAWGGQFDLDEDFSLPPGMAASIVMEQNECH